MSFVQSYNERKKIAAETSEILGREVPAKDIRIIKKGPCEQIEYFNLSFQESEFLREVLRQRDLAQGYKERHDNDFWDAMFADKH